MQHLLLQIRLKVHKHILHLVGIADSLLKVSEISNSRRHCTLFTSVLIVIGTPANYSEGGHHALPSLKNQTLT